MLNNGASGGAQPLRPAPPLRAESSFRFVTASRSCVSHAGVRASMPLPPAALLLWWLLNSGETTMYLEPGISKYSEVDEYKKRRCSAVRHTQGRIAQVAPSPAEGRVTGLGTPRPAVNSVGADNSSPVRDALDRASAWQPAAVGFMAAAAAAEATLASH